MRPGGGRRRPQAWPSLLFLVCLANAALAGPAVVYGPEALRSRLSGVDGGPADVLFFSPGDRLPDLYLPLHSQGKVGSLTIVAPQERPFAESDLASWKAYVSGLSSGAGNTFSLRDGALAGEIGGMKVRVVPVVDWKGEDRGGPVILDLAFLLAMHRDEVRTPLPELPQKFLATVESRKVSPGRVTPWLADRSDLPLERGYLVKLVSETLGDPAAFRQGLPAKWQAVLLGEHLAYLALHEQAISSFDAYLEVDPEEPSILYRIGFTFFVDGDPDRGLRYLHRAYRADPYYIRAYPASAWALYRKGDLDTAERVIRAGLQQDPGFLDLKAGLGRVFLAQAIKLLAADPEEARKRYAEIASLGLPPEFNRQLGKEWEEAQAASASGEGVPPGIPPGHGLGGHGR